MLPGNGVSRQRYLGSGGNGDVKVCCMFGRFLLLSVCVLAFQPERSLDTISTGLYIQISFQNKVLKLNLVSYNG